MKYFCLKIGNPPLSPLEKYQTATYVNVSCLDDGAAG